MNQTIAHVSNKEILANKIKRIRTRIAQATQKEFAEALGVSRIYITQLENPNSPKYPSDALLRRISDLYKIDYIYLTSETHTTLPLEMLTPMDKKNLDTLFHTADKTGTPLQLLAQNYYRLIYNEMQNSLSPKSLDIKSYENYLQVFCLFYEALINTSMLIKDQEKLPNSTIQDILENYLKIVKEQIDALSQKEEK